MIATWRSSTFRMTWASLDAFRENGGIAGAAGGQAPGEIRHRRAGCERQTAGDNVFGCHGQSRGLHLAGRDRLQNALDLAAVDLPRPELERHLDGLARLNISGIDLRDFGTDDRIRRIDEGHHRRQRQVGDPRALAQADIGRVPVGGRAHHRLVQIPLRAFELRLELVDFGLPLLDIETAAGVALEQLRHLGQTCRRKFQLRLDRVDLRLVRHGIDPEQHIACLERLVRLDRNVDHLAGHARHDRDRIAHHQHGPLRRAPSHRNEQPEIEQQQDDERRDFPEQVEADDAEAHQREQQHEIDAEHRDDHGVRSGARVAGTST